MKCEKCGADIPDRKVYCPVCGHEIVLVADYDSIDMIRARKKLADRAGRREEGRQRNARRIFAAWKTAFAAVIAVALAFAGITAIRTHNDGRPEYQRLKAEEAYASGDYGQAAVYCERAVALSPDSEDLYSMLADLYIRSGRDDRAIASLREAYERFGSETILRQLIASYESSGDAAAVAELLRNTENSGLLDEYSSYRASAPEFSLISGKTYPYGTTLSIGCHAGLIRYTTDGTVPDAGSRLYTGPIPLKAGTNRISAASFSDFGVRGPVVSGVFTVKIRQAAASVIRRKNEDDARNDGGEDADEPDDGHGEEDSLLPEDEEEEETSHHTEETDESVPADEDGTEDGSDGGEDADGGDPFTGDGEPSRDEEDPGLIYDDFLYDDEEMDGETPEDENPFLDIDDPDHYDGAEIDFERTDYEFEDAIAE